MSDALGFAFGDALTAGLSEWKSSLARKFQERQAQAAVDEARRRDEFSRQIALVRADAQTHAADTSAGARRYAADASSESLGLLATIGAHDDGHVLARFVVVARLDAERCAVALVKPHHCAWSSYFAPWYRDRRVVKLSQVSRRDPLDRIV